MRYDPLLVLHVSPETTTHLSSLTTATDKYIQEIEEVPCAQKSLRYTTYGGLDSERSSKATKNGCAL